MDDLDRPVHRLRLGQLLRDSRPKSATPEHVDGLVNLYAATATPGVRSVVPFESGINPLAAVAAPDGKRTPAILVASSPHKLGTVGTPWQDVWDVDNGWVRYYGDNREPSEDPTAKVGNRALLAAFRRHEHSDPAERAQAVPLLLFRRVPYDGRVKGQARFEGLAIVTGVELVSQRAPRVEGTFANLAFELLVMDLVAEHEVFDYRWISARRDRSKTAEETLHLAPEAWRDWVQHGSRALTRVRRRVSKLFVEAKAQQMPPPGSKEERLLDAIYRHYDGDKHRFEALAQVVAERVIDAGKRYVRGGLTRATGDGGIDFIARLDVGSGFGRAKLVVLGQAKCERPGNPTSGLHIARTVARLRRGWIGVYVTTSYFTAQAQREVLEDLAPVVLIPGGRVAQVVHTMMVESGIDDVRTLLAEIDASEDRPVVPRDPQELFFE